MVTPERARQTGHGFGDCAASRRNPRKGNLRGSRDTGTPRVSASSSTPMPTSGRHPHRPLLFFHHPFSSTFSISNLFGSRVRFDSSGSSRAAGRGAEFQASGLTWERCWYRWYCCWGRRPTATRGRQLSFVRRRLPAAWHQFGLAGPVDLRRQTCLCGSSD
jgi:hypothetical protein